MQERESIMKMKLHQHEIVADNAKKEEMVNPVKNMVIDKINNTDFKFIGILGGCFRMGSAAKGAYNQERPVHEVCVSSFYLGEHKVTQEQWVAIMGSNPSEYKRGNTYPVEHINWLDAQKFISKLNQLTGKQYRLPTEAEWEFAAKGGSKINPSSESAEDVAVVDDDWYSRVLKNGTKPVKQYQPNVLGLYGMDDYVFELCQDRFDYYPGNAVKLTNPLPISGEINRRVIRAYKRPSARDSVYCDRDEQYVGLRLAHDHIPIRERDKELFFY